MNFCAKIDEKVHFTVEVWGCDLVIQFNKFSMPFYILNWWVGFMWGQISLNPFRIKPKENEGIVFGEGRSCSIRIIPQHLQMLLRTRPLIWCLSYFVALNRNQRICPTAVFQLNLIFVENILLGDICFRKKVILLIYICLGYIPTSCHTHNLKTFSSFNPSFQ